MYSYVYYPFFTVKERSKNKQPRVRTYRYIAVCVIFSIHLLILSNSSSPTEKKRCRISCYSHATNEVYIGREFVVDGTLCSYDEPDDICVQDLSLEVLVMALEALHEEAKPLGLEVSWLKTKVQGKCVALGCDKVVGSRVQEDECGVCDGDGATCTPHTQTYHRTPPMSGAERHVLQSPTQ
ncbi:A disintegrin and metalloproteinase with thrombospondin motifs 3 [Chionoecetes opilio]|uniref:A disintegrin and metalloproteinase with thrombospondin motifs 3 n=1 Tax=Chionoecetes opilio TaxID=41210 RepID=A0A8J4XXG0_CHIOP|nr:A disintegrin and metalloproteinase with thrombospondin motifs 3 [Chionoecetes opilio]